MGGLCIRRAVGQKVVIGAGDSEIIITVYAADRGQARLHIDAPLSISVDRAEVRDRKARKVRKAELVNVPRDSSGRREEVDVLELPEADWCEAELGGEA